MSKKQMGFTLIEIVMVLVLLGILSAVAVPKYFDLQEQALQNAAKATVAEFQARLNARFASFLLQGDECSNAKTYALKGGKASLATDDPLKKELKDDDFGSWTIESVGAESDGKSLVTVKYDGKKYPDTSKVSSDEQEKFKVTLPQCYKSTAGVSGS